MCKDPADKETYCAAVRKPENFLRLAKVEEDNLRYAAYANNPDARPLTQTAQICGFVVEKEREGLCLTAERDGNLDFLASQCPKQAAGLAAAHCAGRRYTAIDARYRNFCSQYASSQSQQNAQQLPATPMDKTKGLLNKGKRALGGLFNN
jgi:hypothetical protein